MVRWYPRLIFVVIGSLAFGSCGSCTCGKKVEEAPRLFPTPHAGFALPTPRQPTPEVKVEPTQVPTVEPTKAPEITTAVPVASLPEDFPGDLPLFEGSEAFAVQQLAGSAKNVLFHVDAERPEIFQHYRGQMQSKGWKLTQEYDARHQSFLSFKKGDIVTQMTISTDPRTGKRVVAIMYQKEDQLPFPEF
jgi:hypothetical protein